MDHILYTFQLIGLGGLAGVLPLYIGMSVALVMLKTLQGAHKSLLMGFTSGVLFYLFFEVMHEAVEFTDVQDVVSWVILTVSLAGSLLGLVTVEQRLRGSSHQTPNVLFLPYMVALGLGLHNLGEGLAIGGSYAQGKWALSGLLVGGFTFHNATEGIAIMGPEGRSHHQLKHILWLGLLAGGPTCLGTVISGFWVSPYLLIAFYSAAAGSLLYVLIALLGVSPSGQRFQTATGITAGIIVMYVTGMFLALLLGFRS